VNAKDSFVNAKDSFALGAFLRESNTEIANAQALLAALTLERFDRACPGLGQPVKSPENLHGGLLWYGSNVRFGLLREDDPLHSRP
jgi:hypothetical protein